jgi:hypothetical protein
MLDNPTHEWQSIPERFKEVAMSQGRLSMCKFKKISRLKWNCNLSKCAIVRVLKFPIAQLLNT